MECSKTNPIILRCRASEQDLIYFCSLLNIRCSRFNGSVGTREKEGVQVETRMCETVNLKDPVTSTDALARDTRRILVSPLQGNQETSLVRLSSLLRQDMKIRDGSFFFMILEEHQLEELDSS